MGSIWKAIGWTILAGAGVVAGARYARGRLNGWDLHGRVVIVTGGSRGLGLVIARELVARGAHVAICARNLDELERAREDLQARGGQVLAVPCDLLEPSQIAFMVQSVRDRFGRIDAVVNNAGIIQVGPQETMTTEDFQRAMALHFWAPLHVIRAVLPDLRTRGEGRIVNVSSIGGRISVPHLLPYVASKYALTGLSRGLRAELKKDNVRVTTVHPGLMRTGSPLHALFKGRHQEEYAWFVSGANLPGLTISAQGAARRIVRALQKGEAEVVLGLPARLAVRVHDLAPGFVYDTLGLVNQLLPGEGGIGSDERTGRESESEAVPRWIASLEARTARSTNEIAPEAPQP